MTRPDTRFPLGLEVEVGGVDFVWEGVSRDGERGLTGEVDGFRDRDGYGGSRLKFQTSDE